MRSSGINSNVSSQHQPLAHKHTKAVCKQGLEVLQVQRMDRLVQLNEGRKTMQAVDTLRPSLQASMLDMGSPAGSMLSV